MDAIMVELGTLIAKGGLFAAMVIYLLFRDYKREQREAEMEKLRLQQDDKRIEADKELAAAFYSTAKSVDKLAVMVEGLRR